MHYYRKRPWNRAHAEAHDLLSLHIRRGWLTPIEVDSPLCAGCRIEYVRIDHTADRGFRRVNGVITRAPSAPRGLFSIESDDGQKYRVGIRNLYRYLLYHAPCAESIRRRPAWQAAIEAARRKKEREMRLFTLHMERERDQRIAARAPWTPAIAARTADQPWR